MFSPDKLKPITFIFLVLFAGCATFEPSLRYQDLVRDRKPTVGEARDGLEISVEEFVSPEKSQQAFAADIGPYGILPLFILVENKTSTNYKVQKSDIKAYLGNDALSPISSEHAANQAATNEYAGKALLWTIAMGPFALFLWPATVASSASHTQVVNQKIRNHFRSLEFIDVRLKSNEKQGGFAYFTLPDGTKRLDNLVVEVQPIEEQSGKKHSFKLSLPLLELSARVSSRAVVTEEKQ